MTSRRVLVAVRSGVVLGSLVGGALVLGVVVSIVVVLAVYAPAAGNEGALNGTRGAALFVPTGVATAGLIMFVGWVLMRGRWARWWAVATEDVAQVECEDCLETLVSGDYHRCHAWDDVSTDEEVGR